jgi:hypothetical protein
VDDVKEKPPTQGLHNEAILNRSLSEAKNTPGHVIRRYPAIPPYPVGFLAEKEEIPAQKSFSFLWELQTHSGDGACFPEDTN